MCVLNKLLAKQAFYDCSKNEKWVRTITSHVMQQNFVSNLENRKVWLLKSCNRPMENISDSEHNILLAQVFFGRQSQRWRWIPYKEAFDLKNIEPVSTLVRSDCRLTLRMLNEQSNLNTLPFTVHQIFTENLHMHPSFGGTLQTNGCSLMTVPHITLLPP